MKTLLVLIRDTETSGKFLEYAMKFGSEMNMALHVMYVEPPVRYPVGNPDLSGAAIARLQDDLRSKLKNGRQKLADLVSQLVGGFEGQQTVNVTANSGNEARIINELVGLGKVQMVMLRNTGREGFWFRDLRIQDVLRDSECPVWVIPEGAEYVPFHRVLYATDYGEEDIPTLRKLVDLTHMHDPEITALHVTRDVDFDLRVKNAGFQKMLESKTDYGRIRVRALAPNNGEPEMDLINSYASRIDADLLVALQENRSFLERIFRQDPAVKMAEGANKPVLLYHAA